MDEAPGIPGPRARRIRPAARARLIATGVAAGASVALVAGMALPGGGAMAATPDGAGAPAAGDTIDGFDGVPAPSAALSSAPGTSADTSTGGS